MFSYRHAFHAGSHADVFKHAVLVYLLRHFAQKEKAFWYIDTHAGAGTYDLRGDHAQKSGESVHGVARLWDQPKLPQALLDYREQVKLFNAQQGNAQALRFYPGSPRIAMQVLRAQDRLRFFEMHSTDSRELLRLVAGEAPRTLAKQIDGFDGAMALLPPPSRRGMLMMDPSYEDKADYHRVITALKGGLERFATGTFMVWYPQVKRLEAQQFPGRLKHVQAKDWLHVTLTVKAAAADGLGLNGSGIFIINPPWTLPQMLAEVMPVLVKLLGQDSHADYTLEETLR